MHCARRGVAQAANRSVAHDLRELVNELDFSILVATVFYDAVKRFLDADQRLVGYISPENIGELMMIRSAR